VSHTFDVPYAGGRLTVHPRADRRLILAAPAEAPALPDLDRAIREALSSPVAGPPLRDLAAGAASAASAAGRSPSVAIAVTDATRDCPDDRFVPALLDELAAGGIRDTDVTIVVATGLHRPSTPAEKVAKLGAPVVARVSIVDHDALDPAGLVDLGRTASGVPAVVSRRAVEADLVLATGVVEPHQYAGWSGGAKTVAIGLAGEPTIAATHGVAMLDRDGVRLANLDGNPFAEAVLEIGRRAGVAFVVNAVLDDAGHAVAVAAGRPEAVHRRLAGIGAGVFTVEVDGQADIAVAGVPPEKGTNLYQASRAATYLHFGPVAAVRRGGAYILAAALPEGEGEGTGERRCAEALREAAAIGPDALLTRLRTEGTRAGEQRAYVIARVLLDARLIVAGAADPGLVRACGMHAAPTLDEALELASTLVRDPGGSAAGTDRVLDVLVVPDAIRTLAVPRTANARLPGQ
jgi:lactate racemase